MDIIIHCMGMPFDGDTVKTRSLGGSESAAYYMARELVELGHSVRVFSRCGASYGVQGPGDYEGVRYIDAGEVTESAPLGDTFHFYAENTPHDVLIIQRHPQAFAHKFASKINLWWVHDLATVRNRGAVHAMLYNIDGVLTVSQFHKDQVCEVYGINPDVVYPITNGVDLSLFAGGCKDAPHFGKWYVSNHVDKDGNPAHSVGDVKEEFDRQIKLLYTSRPERGLEWLVKPGGVMDKLQETDHHLYVCAYDNVTQDTKAYYDYLYGLCDALPNVTRLGALTKQDLADVMRQCDALIYPCPGPHQPNFDEVSCITAMEAMAAGLPMITSDRGALPETCEDSGTVLLKPDDNGMPVIDEFVEAVKQYAGDESLRKAQLAAASRYTWDKPARKVSEQIIQAIILRQRSKPSVAKHLMRMGDIYPLMEYMGEVWDGLELGKGIADELQECYSFATNNTWGEHYEKYYEYEKARGVDYGPEDLSGNSRFEFIYSELANYPAGSVVLDYGCAHGHYTINLAKRLPGLRFVGVDIAQSNIDKARAWAKQDGVENVRFIHGSYDDQSGGITLAEDSLTPLDSSSLRYVEDGFDAIIAAEVVEHVGKPVELVDGLCQYLKDEGRIFITTPYGPWEYQGYREHYPWRAHVWHFERSDIKEMFGHHPGFKINVAPAGHSRWGGVLGSHIYSFEKPAERSQYSDWRRKFDETVPSVQTVSVCMMAKNAESSLLRTLNSVKDVASQIIIRVDPTTTDDTIEVIKRFESTLVAGDPVVNWYMGGDSVVSIGFDEARNETIATAEGDWILWIDSDEELMHPQNLFKYLRNNGYNGYAIKHHHFSLEPLGVQKTDMPTRLFRNFRGVKFYGVVHEHPEDKINHGVGSITLLDDVAITHFGYMTEQIRQGRFNRNIDMMVRDREKYPERLLGKFLWLRDLSQMCGMEYQSNGGYVTDEMIRRAREGVKLWEDLLEGNHLRLVMDGLQFYDTMARIIGGGMEIGFNIETSPHPDGVQGSGGLHTAYFSDKHHYELLHQALLNEKVKDYGSKYLS